MSFEFRIFVLNGRHYMIASLFYFAIVGIICAIIVTTINVLFANTELGGFIWSFVFIIFSFVFVFFAFFKNSDKQKRWYYMWCTALAMLGGLTLFFVRDSYFKTASFANKAIMYLLASCGVSSIYASIVPLLLNLFIKDLIQKHQLPYITQCYFFLVSNLFISLISSFILSIPVYTNEDNSTVKVLTNQILYSTSMWILAGLLYGMIGFFFENHQGPPAGAYDSKGLAFTP